MNLAKNQAELDGLFAQLGWNDLHTYDDSTLNQALNNSMLLELEEDSLIHRYGWTLERVLYSRYYWYTQFLVLYEKTYGKNGSMEQAQFKIIERIDATDEGVDAALLEHIEQELGYLD